MPLVSVSHWKTRYTFPVTLRAEILMTEKRLYSSDLGNKTSLIPESERVLIEYNHVDSAAMVRKLVVDDNLLLKSTVSTRKRVWESIYARYFSSKNTTVTHTLARFVNSPLPGQARYLAMFYEMATALPLIYDLTTDCLYTLYQNGRSTINKADILDWLNQAVNNGHNEINGWSPQTKSKIASNYLTIARDFGLLEGKKNKSFARLYLPIATFVYVLYRLKDEGLNNKAIVTTPDFKLFLLEQRDVFLLLEEATRAGYITFQQAGDIYSLAFQYQDLNEVIDELTRKI